MGADEPTINPEIDSIILIDRYPSALTMFLYLLLIQCKDIDMVTPCCTQLTYEGLIDEVFGINNSTLLTTPLSSTSISPFCSLSILLHVA